MVPKEKMDIECSSNPSHPSTLVSELLTHKLGPVIELYGHRMGTSKHRSYLGMDLMDIDKGIINFYMFMVNNDNKSKLYRIAM